MAGKLHLAGGVPDSGRVRSARAGQGLVEYALILILVAIIMIIVLVSLGDQTKNMFSNVAVALGV